MSAVYVLDSYAIMELVKLENALRVAVLDELTEMIKSGDVRFPDSVWRECDAHKDEVGVGVWAKAVAGHVARDKYDYEWRETVLNECEELLDMDESGPQPQTDVAALALYLHSLAPPPAVTVTADDKPRADRMELSKACAQLGLDVMDMPSFLSNLSCYP